MKKIGLVIIMIVLLATVANAASINGDFEGNPIIKMKSNGKTMAVEDVPAILYKGRTMIPIGMLRGLGVGVTWDQATQSVDVKLPIASTTNGSFSDGPSLVDLNNWAYVASYYSELDSIAYEFDIIAGMLSYASAIAVAGDSNNNDDREMFVNTAKQTTDRIEYLSINFDRLIENNRNLIDDAFNYMGHSFEKFNLVVDGYNKTINKQMEALTSLLAYYQNKNINDYNQYHKYYTESIDLTNNSRKIAKEQFNYWITGIIQQKP